VNRIGAEDALYVTAVLLLYLDLPDTPSRPSAPDRSLARKLHRDAVPLPLVEAALLLGSLRRIERPSDRPPLPKIRSLAYFLPVIAEMQQIPPIHGYLDYLRLKFKNMTQAPSPPDVQKTTFSEDR
jgi:hypothetical protein